MCMEDIKIGRRTTTQWSSVTVTAGGSEPLMAPNSKRIGAMISSIDSTRVLVRPVGAVEASRGMKVAENSQDPLFLGLHNVGVDIERAWEGGGIAAGTTVTIVELILLE